jgi:MFS family permease
VTTPRQVQRTYLALTLLNTLSASLIWGINTLFLLDAGLSNYEAFAANAFYTVGALLFEVPTGVVADVKGRRLSFLLGTVTLSAGTLIYVFLWWSEAPLAAWAVSSMLLGLGFTFFSGAVEAWVVDALQATGFTGYLDSVFGRAQAVSGGSMLVGSVLGGVIAQVTNLGVPFVLRSMLLVATFVLAWVLMRDLGFSPRRDTSPGRAAKEILDNSLRYGLGQPPVRWVMLVGPFTGGVGFYTFYAMQPYLLELYGDPDAYSVAGLAAATIAGAQIVGGITAGPLRRRVRRRTTLLLGANVVAVAALLTSGLVQEFWVVVLMLVVWAAAWAMSGPVRQSYINALIPSNQRATVLSFDSLLGSAGGVVVQPGLGRVADVSGYAATFAIGGLVQACALPFYLLARRTNSPADTQGGRDSTGDAVDG